VTSTAARLALAAVLLATSAGCAFGNRTARLAWPPPGQPLAPAPGATALAVAVVPVVDRRPEPRRQVGTVRNGYYMHTADVETDADLAAWAGAALVDELHRAGVQVVAPAAGVPEVGAELQRVASDAYFVYSGEVDLRAWLRRGGAVIYDAQLHGEGSAGMNWAATGESYTETLTQALGAAARAAARGIAAALLRPAAATASPPLGVARR